MSLPGWNVDNVIQISNDYSMLSEDLTNFPVLIKLCSSSGQNNYNCSNIFTHLAYTLDGSFTGVSGALPDQNVWYINGTQNYPYIYNNKLRATINNTSLDEQNITSKFKLSGDLDVIIDFDLITYSDTSKHITALVIQDGMDYNTSKNYCLIQRRYDSTNSDCYFSSYAINLSWSSEYVVSTSDLSGKLRVVRSGNYIYTYYWNGYSWTSIINGESWATNDVHISIQVARVVDNVANYTADVDNLIVDGSLVWPYGTFPNRKKIAVYDNGKQEHWVETINDAFTATSGSAPNTYLWAESGSSLVTKEIRDNSYYIYSSSSSNYYALLTSKYLLEGDFDIQVSASLTQFSQPSSSASYAPWLYARFNDGADWVMINFGATTTEYRYAFGSNNYGDGTDVTDSFSTGKEVTIRLMRIGSTVYGYYWNGSAWESNTDWVLTGVPTTTADILININQDFDSTVECYVDDFKLNYGNFSWGANTPYKIFKSYSYGIPQQCYCEIASWDQSAEEAYIWCRYPKILCDQPTDLYLYYDVTQNDNINFIGQASETPAKNVWDDNFKLVTHLSQDPTAEVKFTSKVLYTSEVSASHSAGDFVHAIATFSAVDCLFLTKATGFLKIDLKVNNTDYMDNDYGQCQIELTSSNGPDVEEWSYPLNKANDPVGVLNTLSDEYRTYYLPLNYFNSVGGELQVDQIDYIRWYCMAKTSTLYLYWRNAEIIYYPNVLDSTGNLNNAYPSGNLNSNSLIDTSFGKALNFSDVYSRLFIPNDSSLSLGTALTTEVLFYYSSTGGQSAYRILSKGGSTSESPRNYCLFVENLGSGFILRSIVENTSDVTYVTNSDIILSADTYYYGTMTVDNSSKDLSVILDGRYKNSSSFSGDLNTNIADFTFGNLNNSFVDGFIGVLAELRISDVVRSDTWIRITNKTITDDFLNYSTAYLYHVDGHVKQEGVPVRRKVYLYDRSNGQLMDYGESNSSGYYYLRTTHSGEHNLMCLDDDSGEQYLDLLAVKILPEVD